MSMQWLMTNPPPPSFMGYLIHTLHDGTHGGIAWPVHSLAVVGGTPRGAVDVNLMRLMAHGVGFDEVRHVGLIQHAYACGAAEQQSRAQSALIVMAEIINQYL